jgi:hypothetical protein
MLGYFWFLQTNRIPNDWEELLLITISAILPVLIGFFANRQSKNKRDIKTLKAIAIENNLNGRDCDCSKR